MDKERNAKEIGGESNIAAAFMIVWVIYFISHQKWREESFLISSVHEIVIYFYYFYICTIG